MHTIEFDTNTERALARLAAHTGKGADQLIKQAVSEFLSEQDDIAAADAAYLRYQAGQEKSLSLDELKGRTTLLAEMQATVEAQPMQAESAGAFIRRMRDEAI